MSDVNIMGRNLKKSPLTHNRIDKISTPLTQVQKMRNKSEFLAINNLPITFNQHGKEKYELMLQCDKLIAQANTPSAQSDSIYFEDTNYLLCDGELRFWRSRDKVSGLISYAIQQKAYHGGIDITDKPHVLHRKLRIYLNKLHTANR